MLAGHEHLTCMGDASPNMNPKESLRWLHHATTPLRKNGQKKVVLHTGCAQRAVGHTTSLILACLLFSTFSLDQRMPVYKETGQ